MRICVLCAVHYPVVQCVGSTVAQATTNLNNWIFYFKIQCFGSFSECIKLPDASQLFSYFSILFSLFALKLCILAVSSIDLCYGLCFRVFLWRCVYVCVRACVRACARDVSGYFFTFFRQSSFLTVWYAHIGWLFECMPMKGMCLTPHSTQHTHHNLKHMLPQHCKTYNDVFFPINSTKV